jgi:3-dehydroquinate dehydratase
VCSFTIYLEPWLTIVLEKVLKIQHHPHTKIQMNYANYEGKIVEKLGVALEGWPVHGQIRNPGELGYVDAILLRDALNSKECQWIRLNAQQLAARKASNVQRVANGEKVYGPPRKKYAKKTDMMDEGNEGDESDTMDQDTI